MTRYAENTSVPIERSRAEIEHTLSRFGAERFMSGWDQQRAYIAFMAHGRAIRLAIEMPDKAGFARTPKTKKMRAADEAMRAWEQACREKWRGLALLVKAKLVAIDNGDATFENEFLAYTVLPEGQTVSEWLQPQIVQTLATGRMPPLLLAGQ